MKTGTNQFFWQRKTESDRKISDFIKELIKLCEKHRITLFSLGERGIEIYESGYYPELDNPSVTGILSIMFDPDEGVNGKAWLEFTEEAEKGQEEARFENT